AHAHRAHVELPRPPTGREYRGRRVGHAQSDGERGGVVHLMPSSGAACRAIQRPVHHDAGSRPPARGGRSARLPVGRTGRANAAVMTIVDTRMRRTKTAMVSGASFS